MVNFPGISGKKFLVLVTHCTFVTCVYLSTCSLFDDAVNSSDSISLNNWMVVNDGRERFFFPDQQSEY